MNADVKDLLNGAAGERIGRQSGASTSFLQMMDRVFLKLFSEPDVMEAAAARQVMMREAPISDKPPGS